MNGQKLFEQLSRMTEDERKMCQFWQIADKRDFDGHFGSIKCELEDWANEHLEKPSRMKKALKEIKKAITADEIAEIATSTQCIEGECEDAYMDGYNDTYKEQLYKTIQAKLIAYGIVIHTQEELDEAYKFGDAVDEWQRGLAQEQGFELGEKDV